MEQVGIGSRTYPMEASQQECCVCYTLTEKRTPCGHALCHVCMHLLKKPECPLCRHCLGQHSKLRQGNHAPRGRSRFHAWLQRRGETATHVNYDAGPVALSLGSNQVLASPRGALVSSAEAMFSSSQSPLNPTSSERPWISVPAARGLGHVPVAELVARIGCMNLQEAPRLIQHVAWLREVRLIDTRRCTALHRSLGRRLAELVSVASLQVCRDAGGILLVLDPALGSLSIQVSKALEARLAYLLYHPESSGDSGHACTDNLLHLEAHYRCTSEMYRDGVIGLQAHSTVVTHIKGWIVRASVEEMCLHIVSIVALSLEERALEHAVEEKLLKVLPKLDSALQTEHLLALLLQIENLGMTAMCDRLCPVISNWMRLLVEKRSCKNLGQHLRIDGGLANLCHKRQSLAEEVRAGLCTKLVREAEKLFASIKKAEDLTNRRAEFDEWAILVRRAFAADLLALGAESQRAIVHAVTSCTSRCLSDSESTAKELREMEWATVVLVGRCNASVSCVQ